MTKLDILLKSSPLEVWETWKVLGGNTISLTTKIYIENMLYKVNTKKSPLYGYLILCKKEYNGSLDWENCEIYSSGEISFSNSVISPYFQSVLTKEEFDVVVDSGASVDPNFIPFQDPDGEKSTASKLIIPDDIYHICLSDLGYPYITEEELEYSRDQIYELAIKPAFIKYFKWFPKVEIQTVNCTGGIQTVPFPKDAYNYVDFGIKKGIADTTIDEDGVKRGTTGYNVMLRYIDEYLYLNGYGYSSGLTGTYSGIYSPQTYTNNMNNMFLQRAAMQGVENYLHNFSGKTIYNEDGTRSLQFYSNKTGAYAQIAWAKESLDWNDTQLARRPELIELIKAYIKLLFANLRRQHKTDVPGLYDYNQWISEANSTIEKVDTDWKNIIKYSSIIRGSK